MEFTIYNLIAHDFPDKKRHPNKTDLDQKNVTCTTPAKDIVTKQPLPREVYLEATQRGYILPTREGKNNLDEKIQRDPFKALTLGYQLEY